MIRIYLSNDLDQEWDESGQKEVIDNTEALRACQALLRELDRPNKKPEVVVLECYAQMSTGAKGDIENAQRRLVELLNADREYIPAMLAMAHSHMLMKQTPKARNMLKPISKMPPNPLFVEEFERAYLMLADIYIGSKKFDLAQELCEKCVAQNKSCGRAWESLGLVFEKEQSYRDAAEHYETAWRLQNETSPSIGFKLAFNYLKAQRYIDAITVCHKVLAQYPQYPRMKKEILDRARQCIRVATDDQR
ncbi:putative Tetratricopeptide repeat protein 21B [Paratrimastix pyriformis]|uniref:Tetratricopeptide repeat protein 21B n=1 Tax=Paratrimastix pyriformis TaxID=342808 RepID=A0ABQ8UCD6_9EUKA|nr:putative Tetratricopeptide repeat protein 21B [Paratrimastix pyriformis]